MAFKVYDLSLYFVYIYIDKIYLKDGILNFVEFDNLVIFF